MGHLNTFFSLCMQAYLKIDKGIKFDLASAKTTTLWLDLHLLTRWGRNFLGYGCPRIMQFFFIFLYSISTLSISIIDILLGSTFSYHCSAILKIAQPGGLGGRGESGVHGGQDYSYLGFIKYDEAFITESGDPFQNCPPLSESFLLHTAQYLERN